jgi:hypothetical protein
MIRSRAIAGWGLACALLLAAGPGAPSAAAGPGSEDEAFALSGYVKDFLLGLRPPGVDGTAPAAGWLDLADGRLQAIWRPRAELTFCAAYALQASFGDYDASQISVLQPPSVSAYRLGDPGPLYAAPPDAAGHFTLTQNLDRAYATGAFGIGDLTVGRQPVAFGSAKVVNPTDVLAPFTFQTLDKEERSGVDALRLRIPWSDLGELDAGWVAGQDGRLDRSAGFIKPKLNVWGTDVTALAMVFREQGLLGLDLARSVGGASVWLETAYVWAGAFGPERLADQDYLRVSAGADYNLADGLYGFCEYHFNGAGAAQPAAYLDLGGTVAYAQGADYLLGRQYLVPGLSYEVSPLLSVSGQVLWNLGDGSAFLGATATYSLDDNLALVGGAFLAAGRAPASAASGPELRSEFGSYPDEAYLSLKYYF